ncbi:MAG: hypothetical protein HEQ23_08165 [Tepidisphaera sp.]
MHCTRGLLLALATLTASANADVIVTTSSGRMLRVNVETGSATAIATSRWYAGMGWNAAGELLGLRQITTPTLTTSYLDRLNPATGARTTIATTDICVLLRAGSTAGGVGFCIPPGGPAYEFEYQTINPFTQSQVSTVDPATGSVTVIGNLGLTSEGALAADATGRLWGTRGGFGNEFFEIDRTTGAARIVSTLPAGLIIYAMAFERGILYAFDTTGGIHAVNRGTGELSLISRFDRATNGSIYTAIADVPLCQADLNGDRFIDFFDLDAFIAAFEAGTLAADHNADGFIDFFDYADFITAFETGC